MPTLPCPPLPAGVPLDGGALPVSSVSDVEAAWSPDTLVPTDPIGGAIRQGETAMFLEYQRRSRYAAAQSDRLRATDEYEDELFEEHGVFRQDAESNTAYRARGLALTGTVDPNDIIAAANAILAPYTSVSCRYEERSDGWFANKGTATWSSHTFKRADLTTRALTPNYPDRDYQAIPLRQPRGTRANGDSYGRWFLLRCPDIGLIDTEVLAAFKEAPSDGSGFFATKGDGLVAGVPFGIFAYDFASTADGVYNAIIGSVQNLVGQGIRWTLLVDSNLQS